MFLEDSSRSKNKFAGFLSGNVGHYTHLKGAFTTFSGIQVAQAFPPVSFAYSELLTRIQGIEDCRENELTRFL